MTAYQSPATLDSMYQGAPQVSYGGGSPTGQSSTPEWANMWADNYGISPTQLMSNINAGTQKVWRSSGGDSDSGYWEDTGAQGYDINPATGRRYADEQMFPGQTYKDDLTRQWTEGENHLSKKGLLSKYAAMLAGGAILGGGAAAALGAGAGGGMTAAEAAALSSEAAGGITGIGAGGTTAAEAAAAAGLPAGMAGAEAAALGGEAAGNITGIGAGGQTAAQAAAAAGLPGSSATTMSQIANYVKQGMSFAEAAQKVMGAGGAGQAGAGGKAGSIADLLAAYYSAQQMKDYSGNLKGIYSDLNNRQDQFRNQLLASYQDPNQFYGSNQWKGLESVYQNQIDRNAAKTGRMANPTDREVLLQKYGMQELEKYRQGLRDAAGMTKPESALDPLAKGYQAEAYANLAPWAAAGRNGGTQRTVTDTWNTIKDVGSTAEDVWNFISKWFS
jgi:hypothetical protein